MSNRDLVPVGPTADINDQYPRNLVGYGSKPPHPKWPNGAKVAVQFVINYEEGSEYSIPDGDARAETSMSETPGAGPGEGIRDFSAEFYCTNMGAESGFWRLYRLFTARRIPVTIFGAALALECNPEAAAAIRDAGYDVCCHGWRWTNTVHLSEGTERDLINRAIASLQRLLGERPLGWFCGRLGRSANTRRLLVEEGGFLYDSDSYSDELPFWEEVCGRAHLVIPYALDTNDTKFAVSPGYSIGSDFSEYLIDTFDLLYREGDTAPKMMSIGLHPRLCGRPGRFVALERFLDHVQRHDDVWLCRRIDIARHWMAVHPPAPPSGPRDCGT